MTAVTARLVGGSCSVGVGFAWTMAANKPRAKAEVFMMAFVVDEWYADQNEVQIILFAVV